MKSDSLKTFQLVALHSFIVAEVAPSAGIWLCEVVGADRFSISINSRYLSLESLMSCFISIFFIWFLTVPLAIFTCSWCAWARRRDHKTVWHWLVGGIIIGAVFGFGMGRWAQSVAEITGAVGLFVGMLTSLVLRKLWIR
jgi:hypothetical protein